ncbi:hypothetical protein [Stenotrophomonas rhizophila]|uniref:TIGR04086 family membrane protein n=1 Tax=Stenotrophomonas rhizophila TaxID=216778 RepID=A0AAW5PHI4_9GAMM|nr:hypothetical protein [Stenotrophomonas rhizophila]MCS4279186.1 hypothetical protein [Stenotrophomonas rhizophila]
MWRQVVAIFTVAALVLATAHFLGISIIARSGFAFETSDIFSSASGMWFALFGGLISKRYQFAFAVGLLYLGFWGLAIHFVNAGTHAGLVEIFSVNVPNIAVSILSGMLGACVGVFVGSRRRAEP